MELLIHKRTPIPVEESSRQGVWNKAVPDGVLDSLDIEQKSERAARLRRILSQWPLAWLAIAGVLTLAWALALCWAALAFVRWLVG